MIVGCSWAGFLIMMGTLISAIWQGEIPMMRKALPTLFLFGILIVGCSSIAVPRPAPTPTNSPNLLLPSLLPTPTPLPAQLVAWVDESIDPGSFGKEKSIVIHFNRPVDPKSAPDPLVFNPRLLGDFSWSEDRMTLTFTPTSKMKPNVRYTVTIAHTLTSATGDTFGHQTSWFFTRASSPRIVSRLPASSELPLDSPSFSLVFSHHMDQANVEAALSVEPQIPLLFAWEEETLKITLDTEFAPAQKFTFTLAETAVTAEGEALERKTWTYRVAPLTVQFRRETSASRLTPFAFKFSYPMDAASVEKVLSVNPAFDYESAWDAEKKTLTVTPLEPVKSGALITFAFDAGVQVDSGSHGFSEPQSWTYNPPAPVASFEAARYKSRRPELILRMNTALDPESVEAALRVEPTFAYDTSWSSNRTQLKIVPLEPLPSLTTFTIRFKGEVRDADGFPLGSLGVYRYTTPSPIVNEPQIGYGQGPWSGNYFGPEPVKPGEDFLIVFDRPMDPEATLAALTITPPIPGEAVWIDDKTLQIVPSAGHLEEFTEYALTLLPTAVDADGQPVLTEAHTWKAPTTGLPNLAGFGDYGANVQVVDLDGQRAIQIAAVKGLETVQLELYSISIEQFIAFDINTSIAPWAGGRAKRPFDLSGAALAASWASEVVYSDGQNRYNQAAEIYLPEELDEGLYVINLHTDHLDDQMLLVASRSTVAVKYGKRPEGGGPFLAWVSNINDFVMSNVDVQVYNRQGAQIAKGITDAIGVFKTNLPEGTEPYLVVARRGGGITVAGVGRVWGTRGWGSVRRDLADQYFVYLYTERPIYRPGQAVHYKGVVRLDEDLNFQLPAAGLEASLNARDARNNMVASFPVALNEFGTFTGSFEIAEGAMLGNYSLELVIGEESHRQTFKVQDYKKPDIAVTVTTDRSQYVAGDTITVTVEARYLFGEPVTNAALKVNTYELIPQYGHWWGDFSQPRTVEYNWISSRIVQNTLTPNGNGKATFTLPAQIGQATRDYYYYEALPITTQWGIEVTADDGSNQEISAFTVVTVNHAASEARLELGGWLYSPDAPIPVNVALASRFDDPVSQRTLTIDVQKFNDRSFEYRSIQTHNLTTGENGRALLDIALENGSYKLVLTGEDSRGNEFKNERWVYVHDFNETWLQNFTTQLALKAEDRDYAPGETAQIIVETTFTGEGLLTIERGSILEQRMVKLQAPFTVIKVPIKPEYAPNVYVVLQAWNANLTDLTQSEWAYESIPDSTLRWGAVELTVPDTRHALTVEIIPDKASYAPREEATFTIHVADSRGNPVRAEVSLALVDEAIFLLADDPAGDIHDAFYAPRALGVFYYDSMAPWRYLWLDEGGYGGGGGDGSPGAPRANFPDTALWLPSIVTNANGEATVTVTLPDTLTSWRLTAKAVTQNTLIGGGQANALTQQPVVVRPLPPRNLIAGDTFVLSALVHNFSEETLDLEVTARGEGIDLEGTRPQWVRLDSGASRVVSWEGMADAPGEAAFSIIASSPEGQGDSVRMHVTIQPLMIPVFRSETGQFTKETSVLVAPKVGALPESRVRVEVNATVAGSMLKGVEYLTGFPYGCVEQTMSRALPNAVVARAFEQLGLGERANFLGLEGKLTASVQRLYAFQHDDGGWGWWYDDPSDGYQTAWVLFGLAVTAQSGYPVDTGVLARGADFLRWNLDSMNAPTRAFALYATTVAGHGDLDLALKLTAHLSELDHFSGAALALTFHELGESEIANQLLDELLAEMVVDPNGNVYAPREMGDGYYRLKFMSSRIRTTAMILRAVMAIRPDSELRPGMVQWLQSQRRAYGWGATNETAFTLLALTDHLLRHQQQVQDAPVTVFLNDSLVLTDTLTAENLMLEVDIPVGDLIPGENEIRLATDATQALYYVVASEMFVEQAEIDGEGIHITREYLHPLTKQSLKDVREGDLVLVSLTVDIPQTVFYIMLTDHLPGGLEALNEGLNITGHDVAAIERSYHDYEWDPFFYDDYGYNNKEIRADRVIFFVTESGPGKRTFKYTARAKVAGQFTVLPAELSAMYDETIWGRSASQVFVIDIALELSAKVKSRRSGTAAYYMWVAMR